MGKLVKTVIGIGLIIGSFFIPGSSILFIAGLSTGITSAVAAAALLSTGAYLLTAKKPPKIGANLSSSLSVSADPLAARSIAIGQVAIAGQLLYREGSTGEPDKPQDLLAVFALAGYPVDSLVSFWLNGRNITADGIGVDGAVTGGPFAGKLWVYFRNGTETSDAFPALAQASALGWGAKTRRLTGIPAIAIKAKVDEAFEGRLEPLSIVKGARLYDPRLDSTAGGVGLHRFSDPATWEWSENPKLAELLYLRGGFINGVRVFGMGVAQADIDLDSFASEANVCEEQVSVKAGGTIDRYTCNGVLFPDNSHRDNLERLASASGGAPFVSAGVWKTESAIWRVTAATMTEADMIGVPSRMRVAADPSDRLDVLRASFVNTVDNKVADAPEYRVGALVSDERSESTVFQFTNDHRIAQRLMKIMYYRANAVRQIEGTWKIGAAALEPGDIVVQTFARYGFNAQTFRVGAWSLAPIDDARGIPGIGVQMVLSEDRPAWYDWNAATEEQDMLPTATLERVGSAAAPPTVLNIGMGGTLVVDCRANERFALFLNENVTDLAFVNIPIERIIIIEIVQGGTNTIAWPASVLFESGTPYVPTQVAGRVDTVGLSTITGGQEWVLRSSVDVDPNGDGSIPGGGNPDVPDGVEPMDVALDNAVLEGSCDASGGIACIPSAQVTATITGGVAPYTASWVKTVGSAITTINDAASLTPIFSVPSGLSSVDDTSTWRLTAADSTGFIVTKTVQVHLVRHNDDLAITSPGTVFGSCIPVGAGQCTPTASAGVSVSGGTPPYTSLWTYASGSTAITISATNVVSPTFSAPAGKFSGQWNATWRYRVTDSLGSSREIMLAIDLSRESNQ